MCGIRTAETINRFTRQLLFKVLEIVGWNDAVRIKEHQIVTVSPFHTIVAGY